MYEDFRNYGLSEHTEIEIIKHQWRERELYKCQLNEYLLTCESLNVL